MAQRPNDKQQKKFHRCGMQQLDTSAKVGNLTTDNEFKTEFYCTTSTFVRHMFIQHDCDSNIKYITEISFKVAYESTCGTCQMLI